MFVYCECCVSSGRGLCDELITRPEESYQLWCVVVCDLETTKILVNEEEAKAHKGASAPREREREILSIYRHPGHFAKNWWSSHSGAISGFFYREMDGPYSKSFSSVSLRITVAGARTVYRCL